MTQKSTFNKINYRALTRVRKTIKNKMFYSIPVRLLQFFGLLPLEFGDRNVSLSKKWFNWSKIVSLFLVLIIVRRTHITILNYSDIYSGSFLYKKLAYIENYYSGTLYFCVIVTNCYKPNVLTQKKIFNILFHEFEITKNHSKGVLFIFQTLGFATIFLTTNWSIFHFVIQNLDTAAQEEELTYGLLQSIFLMFIIHKLCLCLKLIRDELYLLEKTLSNLSHKKLRWNNFQKLHQITKVLNKFEKLHKPTICLLLMNVFVDLVYAIKGLQNIIDFYTKNKYDMELINLIVLCIWSMHYMPPVIWLIHMREQINTKVKIFPVSQKWD